MKEKTYYHGPIYPDLKQIIRDQFCIGDMVEISMLIGESRKLKDFKKIRILEKWPYFLVAEAADSVPLDCHIRECYTYTDLATVIYVRLCMQF